MPLTPKAILAAVLKLYELGLWIVPCTDKKPVVKDWNETRLTKKEIRRYFRDGRYNIAFVISQSDFIDVECDSDEAEERLQKLFDGSIPATPTWRSSRGFHRLFLRPDGLPKKAKIVIDEIEFRIGNGVAALSTLPPSRHESGVLYKWAKGLTIFDVDVAELPEDIVAKLKSAKSTVSAEPPPEGDEIREGQRNDSLFKLGCRLHCSGLGKTAICQALLAENRERCLPPLPDEEVTSIAESAAKQGNESLDDQLTLWKSHDGIAYASFDINGHVEHWAVRSTHFQMYLRKFFFDHEGTSPNKNAIETIVNGYEARALFSGSTHPVHLRVAEYGSKQYLDLGNDDWTVVEIDESGWRISDQPPVKFRRPHGSGSLPVPATEGSIKELSPFLNVRDPDLPLLLAFLTYSLRPVGPYVILRIQGEQGSAKSTTARMIRLLVDPNDAPARSMPRSEQDLAISVENSWLYCLDNLSFVGKDMSDAICRLATTGVGFATRRLYTDSDEMIFNAMRPVLMASIEDVGARNDLVDRSVTIDLPSIPDSKRRDEKSIWLDFEEARPRILGALLDAISIGIRRLPDIQLDQLPRMADFLKWAAAVEVAFGFEAGTCHAAYERNRSEAHLTVLEESPVAATLIRFMQRRDGEDYDGNATDLLSELRRLHQTSPEMFRQKSWPKNPRSLSAALNRLAPNLRHVGITVAASTTGSGSAKRRRIIVRSDNRLPPLSEEDQQTKKIAESFRRKSAKRKRNR